MIKKSGNFYLMQGNYTAHSLDNGDISSKFIMLEYLTEHPSNVSSGQATTTRRSSTGKPPRSNTPASTRIVNRSSTPTSSGSSGSSRSSGGGGY